MICRLGFTPVRLLEEFGVRWPYVVQGGQEERRDAERSVPAVASPLLALPTKLAQRHRRHGKRQVVTRLFDTERSTFP